jgi:steroid 5-alpha reductase family enzyme
MKYFVGEVTGNTSQVDKLWSLLPVIYAVLLALANPHPRYSIFFSLFPFVKASVVWRKLIVIGLGAFCY